MAWKRSSVRSRSGPPTNPSIPTIYRHYPTASNCVEVLKHFRSTRQHHLDHLRVCVPLLLRDCSGVNIERRSDVHMTQLVPAPPLRPLPSPAGSSPAKMTEVVPADHLPHNARPFEHGTDVPLEQVVGTHRFLALEPDRREDEIRVGFIERFPFPLQQ